MKRLSMTKLHTKPHQIDMALEGLIKINYNHKKVSTIVNDMMGPQMSHRHYQSDGPVGKMESFLWAALAGYVFTVVFNSLLLVVLQRPSLKNTANRLLSALAIVDLITVCVRAAFLGITYGMPGGNPYIKAYFAIPSWLHLIAMYLTVSMAIIRQVILRFRYDVVVRYCLCNLRQRSMF